MWLSIKLEYIKPVSVTHKIQKYSFYNISASLCASSRHFNTVGYFVMHSVTIEVGIVVVP